MGRLHGLLRPAANPSLTLALDGAGWALEERAELIGQVETPLDPVSWALRQPLGFLPRNSQPRSDFRHLRLPLFLVPFPGHEERPEHRKAGAPEQPGP